MGVFKYFPYTNFHELNLNWIMEKVEQAYDLSIINKDELEKIKSVISDPLTDEQKQQVFEYLLEIIMQELLCLMLHFGLDSKEIVLCLEHAFDILAEDGPNLLRMFSGSLYIARQHKEEIDIVCLKNQRIPVKETVLKVVRDLIVLAVHGH